MHVIGFAGYSKAGKTTAADLIRRTIHVESQVVTFQKMAFADALRRVAENVFGYLHPNPRDLFQGLKEKPISELEGWTPRKILQHLGTEGFRAVDPDVWVRTLEHTLTQMKTKREAWVTPVHPLVIVIDDVRFPNEAAMVRRWGKLYRIDRPEISAESAHASEQHIPSLEVDGVIANAGTLDDFAMLLRPLLKEIL